jgi:predicted ATP-dependent protease
MLSLALLLDELETTASVETTEDPFKKIIGQDHAIALVRSAIVQRRHVLLCGVPGIGKSMLAKAAYSLLPPPRQEIRLQANPTQPDRPLVVVSESGQFQEQPDQGQHSSYYMRAEDLPFEVAIKMGYRCPKCGAYSHPSQVVCMDCGGAKRSEWDQKGAFHGLLHVLDVIKDPAQTRVTSEGSLIDGHTSTLTYSRTNTDLILVTKEIKSTLKDSPVEPEDERVFIPLGAPRFVRASGFSPVELLGDVKHDPFGSAEGLAKAAHTRVVAGAIHEAHEGILYVDELAALGEYQKHLLTAMQDRYYAISGHNPQSSGASVRVDDVPCDFLLFASCNPEDLPKIIPPLRSRIRGYGYEIMLHSWVEKTPENVGSLVQFIAQTIREDGKIPHMSGNAVKEVISIAENMAYHLDGKRQALTLRLRELGGLVRVAGDLAVQDASQLIDVTHIERAEQIHHGIDLEGHPNTHLTTKAPSSYGDYFF